MTENYNEAELLGIAEAIFNQMGGLKNICRMTAAYNFKSVNEGNNVAVSWQFKGSKSYNFVKVLYTPMDEYILQIGQIRKFKGVPKLVIKYCNECVYCDEIKGYFENATGLYLTLF